MLFLTPVFSKNRLVFPDFWLFFPIFGVFFPKKAGVIQSMKSSKWAFFPKISSK